MTSRGVDRISVALPSEYVPAHEVRSLTGLRGVAALDVVIGHYDIHNNRFIHPFVFHDAAVDVFFCLSSFTLCLVYLANERNFKLGSFAVARFARIYPLFVLMMVVCLLTGYFWGDEAFPRFTNAFILKHTLAQLTLVAALPTKSLAGFWNPAAWSVAIEVVCYIVLFPAFAGCWHRILRISPRLLFIFIFLCGLLCHLTYIDLYDPLVNLIGFPPAPNYWSYWVSLIRGVTMFTAGAFSFAVVQAHHDLRNALGKMTDAILLTIVAIIAGGSFSLVDRHALVVLTPLLIIGLLDSHSLTARILASGPLHFLGLISYSIYLWHLPLYQITLHLHPAFMKSEPERILAPMVATLIFSILSYYLYEAPARRFVRRLFDLKRANSSRKTP